LTVLFSINSYGQIQQPKTPTFGGQTPINPSQSYSKGQYPNGNNSQTIIQQQNRQVMQQMGYNPPPTQAEIQANINQQRQANYQQQLSYQEKQKKILYTILSEEKTTSYTTNKKYSYAQYGKYRFSNPNSTTYQKHIKYYQEAYDEINKMLQGEKPISLKDAIYYSENAFLAGELTYQQYEVV